MNRLTTKVRPKRFSPRNQYKHPTSEKLINPSTVYLALSDLNISGRVAGIPPSKRQERTHLNPPSYRKLTDLKRRLSPHCHALAQKCTTITAEVDLLEIIIGLDMDGARDTWKLQRYRPWVQIS
jgi:hypothetical protein